MVTFIPPYMGEEIKSHAERKKGFYNCGVLCSVTGTDDNASGIVVQLSRQKFKHFIMN